MLIMFHPGCGPSIFLRYRYRYRSRSRSRYCYYYYYLRKKSFISFY